MKPHSDSCLYSKKKVTRTPKWSRKSSKRRLVVDDDDDNGSPKSVRFHQIEVAQFPIELGDNPACGEGVPVQLGWELQSRDTFCLDHYETLVSPTCSRRSKKNLRLCPETRKKIVLSQGTSLRDTIQVTRDIQRIKMFREKNSKREDSFRRSAGRTTRRTTTERSNKSSSSRNLARDIQSKRREQIRLSVEKFAPLPAL